jgi:hypothetical protein
MRHVRADRAVPTVPCQTVLVLLVVAGSSIPAWPHAAA